MGTISIEKINLSAVKGFSLLETVMAVLVLSSLFVLSTGLLANLTIRRPNTETSELKEIRTEIFLNFIDKENCQATINALTWNERRPYGGDINVRNVLDKNGSTLYDTTTDIQGYTFDQVRIQNFKAISTGSKNRVFLADLYIDFKKNSERITDTEPQKAIVRGSGTSNFGSIMGCGTYRTKYWETSELTDGYFTDFNASIGHSGAPAAKVDIAGPVRLTSNADNGLITEMRNAPSNHTYIGLQNPGQLTISNTGTRDDFNIYSNNNVTLGANDYNSAKLEMVDTLEEPTGLLALSHGWSVNFGFFLNTDTVSGDNLSLIKTSGLGNIVVVSSLHIGDNNGLAGGYRFYVNGTAGGTLPWQVVSDKRLKTDIVEIKDEDILKKLLQLNGYYFRWKNTNKKDFGVIAQEVQKQFPELVYKSTEGTLYVKKDLLALYLAKALIQINIEQDNLNNDIDFLVNEVCNFNPKDKICL